MKKYQIAYSQKAIEDLNNIVFYINNQLCAYNTALKTYSKIRAKIDKLTDNPLICEVIESKTRVKDLRKLVIDNYLVFYSVEEKEKIVKIYRIMNGRRNWKRMI
jgi:addiction module RelE/StbE family toxin